MRIKDVTLLKIREFLNSEDLGLTGTVQCTQTLLGAYITDKELEFLESKGFKKDAIYQEIEAYLELRDCSRTISLDFCVNDDKTYKNILNKLNSLIDILTKVKVNITEYYREIKVYKESSEEFEKLEKEENLAKIEGCQSD